MGREGSIGWREAGGMAHSLPFAPLEMEIAAFFLPFGRLDGRGRLLCSHLVSRRPHFRSLAAGDPCAPPPRLLTTLSDCERPPRPGINARATPETKSRLKPAPKPKPLLQEPGSPGFSVAA